MHQTSDLADSDNSNFKECFRILETIWKDLHSPGPERRKTCRILHLERCVMSDQCLQTLTPVQEAQLDVACYPWCPDVWNLASILAAKHGEDTPDTIRSDANNAVVPAASLVPQHCTAEMLALPLLAHGYGLQLKRKAL